MVVLVSVMVVCISLIISSVEHFFMCLFEVFISPLEKCLDRSSTHFFDWVVWFFLTLSYMSYLYILKINPLSVQFSSVAQSCLTLCDPMNRSTPGLTVHHQLLEFTKTHAHQVGDAIQPSHSLSSPDHLTT